MSHQQSASRQDIPGPTTVLEAAGGRTGGTRQYRVSSLQPPALACYCSAKMGWVGWWDGGWVGGWPGDHRSDGVWRFTRQETYCTVYVAGGEEWLEDGG